MLSGLRFQSEKLDDDPGGQYQISQSRNLQIFLVTKKETPSVNGYSHSFPSNISSIDINSPIKTTAKHPVAWIYWGKKKGDKFPFGWEIPLELGKLILGKSSYF